MSKNTLLSELINYVSANSSGNVTIAAPSSGLALDVNGTGRFTGALNGTSATFSGQTRIETDGSTPQFFIKETDVTGQGSTAYFQLSNNTIYIGNGNASYGTLSDKLTIASSGAATFSSSVTAGSWIKTSNNIFTGGNDTGVFLTGSSSDFSWGLNRESAGLTLYAGSASAPKMTITTAGSVGIGTTSPSATLHVSGAAGNQIRYSSPNVSNILGVSSSDVGIVGTVTGHDLAIYTNATERMRITSGGSVGIGTGSPSEKLTVIGKGYFQPYLPAVISGASGYYGTNITLASDTGATQGANRIWSRYDGSGSPAISIEVSTTTQGYNSDPQTLTYSEIVRIKGNGNVLIGTTTDSGYKLDVNGTGRFTGALTGTSITLSNSLNFTSIYGGNINGYDGTSLVSMNYNASQHQYYAGGTLKMMLLGNGNLLLGTTSDSGYPFIVAKARDGWQAAFVNAASAGTAQVFLSHGEGYGAYIDSGSAGDSSSRYIFKAVSGGSARLTIRGDGNVGIGTESPSNRLQVSGNIYSTDTVFARNLKPEAFASVSAGTPTGAGIPLGYSTLNISSPCDGNWRAIMSNINDVKGYFWVTLGDAASKDTANYFMAMTSVGYGVYNFGAVSYQDNGWNTGGFEFTYDTAGGTLRLLVRCTSYYSSANTAYGTIYFLRME